MKATCLVLSSTASRGALVSGCWTHRKSLTTDSQHQRGCIASSSVANPAEGLACETTIGNHEKENDVSPALYDDVRSWLHRGTNKTTMTSLSD